MKKKTITKGTMDCVSNVDILHFVSMWSGKRRNAC